MSRNQIGLLPCLFAVVLLTAACGKKEEPKVVAPAQAVLAPPTAQSPLPQPLPPAAAPVPQAAASAPPASAAPQAAPVKPLASADGETPGSRIEVQELKRVSGDTMMLRFALINDADVPLRVGFNFGAMSSYDYDSVAGVHLIEPVGKKKYLVVRDSANKCDCSRGVKDVAAKSRANLWARFPAPPDSVDKIVVVVPKFSPMDDLPIGR